MIHIGKFPGASETRIPGPVNVGISISCHLLLNIVYELKWKKTKKYLAAVCVNNFLIFILFFYIGMLTLKAGKLTPDQRSVRHRATPLSTTLTRVINGRFTGSCRAVDLDLGNVKY